MTTRPSWKHKLWNCAPLETCLLGCCFPCIPQQFMEELAVDWTNLTQTIATVTAWCFAPYSLLDAACRLSGTIVLRYGTSKEWTETPAETAVQASVAHVVHLFSNTNKYERRKATWMRKVRRLQGSGQLGQGRGDRGAFKLELAPYGYTFVGKGTLSCYHRRLEHESRVYARLNRIQGKGVPVHLGKVQMARGHVLPGGARVVHMMLMSWGGEEASDVSASDLTAEVRRSSQEVWAEGVDHGDERDPNLLWNTERHRVMLVDFDRATLRPILKHKQVMKLSGNKRKKPAYDVGVHGGKRSSLQSESRIYYYDHRVYIVHLTLTSWGGESLHEAS
ncbi:hypothetical protein Purlil1_12729 [Purpureocillium lilacinum]|uniref:Protein kinase-like domain n=1 Tax=Purpureocillium lilacinum TaxID=33203 RepID=A0ABR0BG27_PURLI|nr:hypothetical protein Purlil1_12729 [Purpureocillium lilacinum]